MTNKRRKAADPAAFWQSLLAGTTWNQNMIEGPVRAQAKLAAETLQQLNAPIVEALARQRELADLLASTAKQTSEVADRVKQLARAHSALTKEFEAAMEPYLQYVQWLGRVGSGENAD